MKISKLSLAVIFGAAILVVSAAYWHFRGGQNTLPPQYFQSKISSLKKTKKIDHIVVIMEENRPKREIVGNPQAEYINKLLKLGASANNYYAVTHPSLPNYLALTSGTTGGITSDCLPADSGCKIHSDNIADNIEDSGRTWKAYTESMPSPCSGVNFHYFVVKHSPFFYFPDVFENKQRCQNYVVPFSQFAADLSKKTSLPNFAFITPNICNDMHSCSVNTGDVWLAREVPKILNSPAFTRQNSLLIITWDEGNRRNNNVLTIFLGPAAKKNFVSQKYYSHYSLLHTIENNWGLKTLTKNDHDAPFMTDMLIT